MEQDPFNENQEFRIEILFRIQILSQIVHDGENSEIFALFRAALVKNIKFRKFVELWCAFMKNLINVYYFQTKFPSFR